MELAHPRARAVPEATLSWPERYVATRVLRDSGNN